MTLSIRNLSWAYDAGPVLSDLSFEVSPGEICVVLGPSGCGKTTLLHLLAGLLPGAKGAITLNGRPPRPGRDTAMVFQDTRLLPWRRVARNLEIVMRGPRAGRRARAESLLERVGLAGQGEAWPEELSGGMQQRLALARAFATPAGVLLLDEPFASLDPLAREQMQAELLRLRRHEPDRSMVFVTHSIGEALVLADRILLLAPRPGRIAMALTQEWDVEGLARRHSPRWESEYRKLDLALRAVAGQNPMPG